jgi:hypothetical protein
MDFKFGVTLIRYENEEISSYDLRVERVFEGVPNGVKRTDYVFIPLTSQEVRFLEGIEVPMETINYKDYQQDE